MIPKLNATAFLVACAIALSPSCRGQIPSPKPGEIHGPVSWKSKIYPGTERDYWIYVPAQYDAGKAACVMIVQDGLNRANDWNLPKTLDSLIAAQVIPVTIGIFIDHGKVATTGVDSYPRFNRSFEYDALGDRYARFLVEEILPEVGRTFNLSRNPDDRLIAGASSGAICAFNAAWERPDQFRRVLSTIGTYVGLRGGDEFSTLVRKTESKPLRIFLEDGSHDLNIYAGDWWTANQSILSALTWAGYEVEHNWGDGGHNGKHAASIMPQALTWLWKDYPAPVQTHKGNTPRLDLLLENEPWKETALRGITAEKMAANKSGDIYFTSNQSIYRIDGQGKAWLFSKLSGKAGGISFSDDGKLYAADLSAHKIITVDEKGNQQDAVKSVDADFMIISSKGIYFAETGKSRVGFYSSTTKMDNYVTVPGFPTGLALSAEQTLLSVSLATHVLGYSFRLGADGSPDHGQEYIHYHVPYGNSVPGAAGMTVDSDNLLYTSTTMGVQVSDQLGRVNFIFSKPGEGSGDVKFGGPELSTLYLICGGKLFNRKINVKGVQPWLPPVKPPKPGM